MHPVSADLAVAHVKCSMINGPSNKIRGKTGRASKAEERDSAYAVPSFSITVLNMFDVKIILLLITLITFMTD